jgi:hypothetical protein
MEDPRRFLMRLSVMKRLGHIHDIRSNSIFIGGSALSS